MKAFCKFWLMTSLSLFPPSLPSILQTIVSWEVCWLEFRGLKFLSGFSPWYTFQMIKCKVHGCRCVCLHTCMPFVIGIINWIFGMIGEACHIMSKLRWISELWTLHLPSIILLHLCIYIYIYTLTMTVWKNCFLILLFSSVVTISKFMKSKFYICQLYFQYTTCT